MILIRENKTIVYAKQSHNLFIYGIIAIKNIILTIILIEENQLF